MKETVYTKRRQKRRLFAIKFGVYIAMFVGVLVQSSIAKIDFRSLDIEWRSNAWQIARVPVAMFGAVIAYQAFERDGELDGKIKRVGRILRSAFLYGVFISDLTSIGSA